MTSTSAGLSRHAKKRNVLIPMGGSLNSNRRLFEFAASNLFDDVDNVFVFHYERKHNPSDPTPATQRQGFQIVNIDKPLDTPPDSSEAEDHGSKAAEADWLPRAVSDALRKQRRACPSATCIVFKIDGSANIDSAEEAVIEICKGTFQSTSSMFPDHMAIPKPDIVCLGARGRGILKRFMMGSVSNAVASRAECSVCVFRDSLPATDPSEVATLRYQFRDSGPDAGEQRAICIALGGSDASVVVVKWVAETLLRPTDRIVLLHCEDNKKSERRGLTKELIGANMRKCEEILREYAAKHPDPAGQEYCIIEEEGESSVDIRDRLLDFIQNKTDVNLLVLGKSNRTAGIRSILLGSVPRYVLNHGKCPVLVVNPSGGPAPKKSEGNNPQAAA